MTTTEDVAKHLVFDKVKSDNLISYSLKDHANGDPWKEIKVIFNGADNPQEVKIPAGKWLVIARDGQINADGMGQMKGGKTLVEPRSALIIAKEK